MGTLIQLCKCKTSIKMDDVETLLCTNEEGEEYTKIEYDCSNCDIHFELEEWGEISEEESVELIMEHLKFK